jgi:tetratricopeptide (TPR) repeat protein
MVLGRYERMAGIAAALLLAATAGARADTVVADGFTYDWTLVLGLRGDKFVFRTQQGKDVTVALNTVSKILLDKAPNFNGAEESRDSDAKKAAALYREALSQEMNAATLRPMAWWRAIGPTDADGRWTDAVSLFLNLYATCPTDTIWKLRPTHVPAKGSSMLKESADLIGKKVAALPQAGPVGGAAGDLNWTDVRKRLQTWQVDLYTRAGETDTAARLARVLAGGAPDDDAAGAAPAAPAAHNGEITVVEMAPIEDAIKTGHYDAAISQADKLMDHANADGAVALFLAKARAYAGEKQPELAVANYLRVAIHYSASKEAPGALAAAADLQRQLGHVAEADRLLKEIKDKYPDSPEALKGVPPAASVVPAPPR